MRVARLAAAAVLSAATAACAVAPEADYVAAMAYLRANMLPSDRLQAPSLFGAGGLVDAGVNVSIANRYTLPWAGVDTVPDAVFEEYVLPYANTNEARTSWRPLLKQALLPLVRNATFTAASVDEVVSIVNGYDGPESLWTALGSAPIVFKSDQTPLIYDPMSVLLYRYASCTGVSILLVDALRSVGVAARLAGTPSWNGGSSISNNHNWIEVYRGVQDGWSFIEAKPAGSGETLGNPCDKWFCNPAHMANGTQVFAAAFSRHLPSSSIRYPMAWDVRNDEVIGVDRTDYYQEACNAC